MVLMRYLKNFEYDRKKGRFKSLLFKITESKVIDAFSVSNPATLDELLPIVYADTPPRLHQVARRSLHAHLLKLAHDGRVERQGERWKLRS